MVKHAAKYEEEWGNKQLHFGSKEVQWTNNWQVVNSEGTLGTGKLIIAK